MSKTSLEALVKAGALDSFNIDRGALTAIIPAEIQRAKGWGKLIDKGSWSIFGDASESGTITPPESYPQEKWTLEEYQDGEGDSLGFYISGHPLESIKTMYALCATHSAKMLNNLPEKKKVIIAGIIRQHKIKQVKTGKNKGKKYAIFNVEDMSGKTPCTMLTKAYGDFGDIVQENARVSVVGTVGEGNITNKDIQVKELYSMETFLLDLTKDVRLIVNPETIDLSQLRDIILQNPGQVRVFLHSKTANNSVVFQISDRVKLSHEFLHSVELLVEEGCLRRNIRLCE